MADDLFECLEGLMHGLSDSMPLDDLDVKLMNLQSRLDGLLWEELSVCADVGRRALAEHSGGFSEQEAELTRIRSKIAGTEAELSGVQQSKQEAEQAQRREEALHICPQCGCWNPDGMKFCLECGTKLGPAISRACGAELTPGMRFCGKCGAKQRRGISVAAMAAAGGPAASARASCSAPAARRVGRCRRQRRRPRLCCAVSMKRQRDSKAPLIFLDSAKKAIRERPRRRKRSLFFASRNKIAV